MSNNLIIIDTDPGVDDSWAILVALNSQTRHLANVLAITTVHGNTDIDQVCLNALRVLQVADRLDIPVYRGVDKMLVGSTGENSSYYHGNDGLGDVPDPSAPDLSNVQNEHAVLALIRLVNQHAGKITLVCIGPLTNVAVALRIDRTFGTKLRQCIIMGGNTTGKGNCTSSAEFNFYKDPEAANVVLHELGCRITMIPWEFCLQYSLPWDMYDKLLETRSTRSEFINRIHAYAIRQYYDNKNSENKDIDKFILCDEIAVAIAINDKVLTAVEEATCSVQPKDSSIRGQMVIDQASSNTDTAKVRLATELDTETIVQLLAAAVTD